MTRTVLVFVAIAYTLSIAFSLIVGLIGYRRPVAFQRGLAGMFIPALAVLTVRLPCTNPCCSHGIRSLLDIYPSLCS